MAQGSFQLNRQPAPLRMQVRELLRAEIVEMRLKPGQRLVERELCELAGVSRAVIREVLRELETDGLVRIVANKGPVVAGPMSIDEARNLYETRAVLEGLAGANFVERATAEDRDKLHVAFAALEAVYRIDDQDARAILNAKAEFYGVILAGARNGTVTTILRSLRDRITTLRALTVVAPGRAQYSIDEIRRIVEAIDKGSAKAASTACIKHVQSAARQALAILAEQAKRIGEETEEAAARTSALAAAPRGRGAGKAASARQTA